jgi:hypothetical protein
VSAQYSLKYSKRVSLQYTLQNRKRVSLQLRKFTVQGEGGVYRTVYSAGRE